MGGFNMTKKLICALALSASLIAVGSALAQQPASTPAPAPAAAPAGPPPGPTAPAYGTPITIEQAKKAAAAAIEEAKKNNWRMAVAIVEPSGALVYFEKMDDTQYGSEVVALGKATSSAKFRRPTQAFHDGIKAGNAYLLRLEGANPVPGGFPIVVGGKIIGGMGASGGTGDQDAWIVQAGMGALK
jgi:uncharacterized protein GlcG (DUF336 family)